MKRIFIPLLFLAHSAFAYGAAQNVRIMGDADNAIVSSGSLHTYVANVSSAGISISYPLYIAWAGSNSIMNDLVLYGASITFVNPGAIINPNYVQFSTSWSDGSSVGRLQWNSTDGTLEFGALGGDVNIQIGQESVVFARNTGALIANGSVVRISGESGGRPKIELADANDTTKDDHILGVTTEEIGNNDNGYVTSFGLVRGLNTNSFNAGDELYLSETAGEFTNVSPAIPSKIIHVGHVIVKGVNDGVILVTISEGCENETLGSVYADRLAISTGNFSTYGVAIGTPTVFVGDGTFWEDLRTPLTATTGGPTSPAVLKSFRKNLAGTSRGTYVYTFGNESVEGNQHELYFTLQMPHKWKQGTAIKPHLHYSVITASTPTTNDTMIMGLEYSCDGITGTFPVTTTILSTQTVPSPYNGSYLTFADISVPSGLSSLCAFRIFRNSSSTTDNFTGDIYALEFDVHYEADSLGSRKELIK